MSIPVIDLSPLRDGSAGAVEALAAEIGAACEDIGFFTITGHGVDAGLIDRASAAGRAFFDRPEADKLRHAIGDRQGLVANLPQYYPIEEEALAAGLGEKTPGDLKEALGFGPNDRGRPWPDEPVDLRGALEAYFAGLLLLGERLRGLLLLALGQPADALDGLFPADGGASYLKVINYPERADALPGQQRAGAHTDYGYLTILRSQDSAGGLQVADRDGDWIDVQGVGNAFVVNIGDALSVWSNDRFVSTLHRVVTPPDGRVAGSRRQSLAFFYGPSPSALVAPITRPGEEPRHAPVTYQELQDEKVRRAHAMIDG